MKSPETYQEYLIWLGMQFPVLAAVGFAARWVVRHMTAAENRHRAELRLEREATLAEKERVIGDRDRTIEELKSRIRSLERENRKLRRGERG